MKAAQLGSGAMFDAVARRYDLLNRVISLGLDGRWRRRLCSSIAPAQPRRILDVAAGTLDVTLMLARRYPDAELIGLDPSDGMLAVGRKKLAGRRARVRTLRAVGEHLPLADDSVDAVTIAFGIRNVPDRPAALAECARVTRPGGVVSILELSEPRTGWLAPFARFHVHWVVPHIGALVGGSREYAYLARSIAAFPEPDVFCGLCREAGLTDVSAAPLDLGAVHLYTGRVPE